MTINAQYISGFQNIVVLGCDVALVVDKDAFGEVYSGDANGADIIVNNKTNTTPFSCPGQIRKHQYSGNYCPEFHNTCDTCFRSPYSHVSSFKQSLFSC